MAVALKEEKALTLVELRAELKVQTAKADQATAELNKIKAQATSISQSYLDIRDTARDIATIVSAQGRLFAKLPGIYEPKK